MMMTHMCTSSVKHTHSPNSITGRSGAQTRITVSLIATLPQLMRTGIGTMDNASDYGSEEFRFDA